MKKIVLGVAALVGMLAFSGCNDYLDKIPDNRTELDSKDKIAELLVNAYPKASYIPFTEVMSDNAGDKGSDAKVTQLSNTEPFFWKDCTNDGFDTPPSYWDACYTAIAHANLALEAIAQSPEREAMAEQRGEALLCRAYAHFMLVTLFSKTYDKATAATDMGIPYVTEVERVVKKEYARGTVASVYANIERDLQEGMLLNANNTFKSPKFHFNKNAACAFASRFYLFKKEYDNVIRYSDKVLGAAPTSKFRNWASYADKQYNAVKQLYTASSESCNLLLQETLTSWGQLYFYNRYAYTTDKMDESFVNANVSGGQWLSLFQLSGDNMVVHLPKFHVFFKKVGVGASTGWPYIMAPLFTVEEVFFNRLEAKVLGGKAPVSEVITDLNLFLSLRIKGYVAPKNSVTMEKITAFYGLASNQENLLECILDFKKVEYLHEGLRWFDILRHKRVVVHKTFDGQDVTLKADDARRVIQLPLRAVNSGLPQNPR